MANALNFPTGIDLKKAPILNAAYQVLASDPSSPVLGQYYYNSGTGKKRTFNGTTWDEEGGDGAGDASTNTSSSVDNEIVLFSGTGGKTLKRMTGSGLVKVTSGVASVYTLVEADIPTLSQSKITSLGTDLTARELLTNKSTSTSLGTSDTLYPTQNAVKVFTEAAIAAAVTGLWDDRGSHSASGNTFPSSGGSGTAGAILKGDIWTISAAGTLGGSPVTAGDTVRALVDTPGTTASNWAIGENNIGYVPENSTNKATSLASPDNTKYPTVQAIVTALEGYGRKASALVGNGSATSFNVTHSFNTKNVIVSVRKVSTDEFWYVDLAASNVNYVVVSFATAPTTNEFEVTVIG